MNLYSDKLISFEDNGINIKLDGSDINNIFSEAIINDDVAMQFIAISIWESFIVLNRDERDKALELILRLNAEEIIKILSRGIGLSINKIRSVIIDGLIELANSKSSQNDTSPNS